MMKYIKKVNLEIVYRMGINSILSLFKRHSKKEIAVRNAFVGMNIVLYVITLIFNV